MQKKVAVVGAGFSGLALCWFLLEKGCQVDLYDQKGVGCGASGVAAGLVHPYAGEQLRRSWEADVALEETRKLLGAAQAFSKDPVADFSGLLRLVDAKQAGILEEHARTYGDVVKLSEHQFLITSGIAVYSTAYLNALYAACTAKGLTLHLQKVESFASLDSYDLSFFAIGGGIFQFSGIESLKLKPVRGQALLCKWPCHLPKLERALLGKGYIVPVPGGDVYLGSTYERGSLEESPDLAFALEELRHKAKTLVPAWDPLTVRECRAGIRVAKVGHYAPLGVKVGDKAFVLTGMGSRGLLYHAYAAQKLVMEALE